MNFDEIKKNVSKKIVRKKILKKKDDIHETNLKTRENEFTTRAKISKSIRRCSSKSSFRLSKKKFDMIFNKKFMHGKIIKKN